jgi:hypothetical protein
MAKPPVRRVVTGHDEKGQSAVLFDGLTPNVRQRSSGVVSTMLWHNAFISVDAKAE